MPPRNRQPEAPEEPVQKNEEMTAGAVGAAEDSSEWSADGWDVVEEESPTVVVFDVPGDKLIGIYKGKTEIVPEKGEPFTRHLFIGLDGKPYAVNDSYNLAVGLAKVNIDDLTKVEFIKAIDTSRGLNPLKDYRVSVKR